MPLVHFATSDTRTLNQRQDADRASRMTGYDERLVDLEAMGVDLQVVKPPPPQCYYTLPIEIADKASQMVNDGLAEYVSRHPDRFVAFGTVPLQDGGAAATELERCVKKLGFKGVQILTNVAGRELSDPAFASFWAKAEQLDVLVVLHPNGFTQADRLSQFTLTTSSETPSIPASRYTTLSSTAFWSAIPTSIFSLCMAAAISPPIPAVSIMPGARVLIAAAHSESADIVFEEGVLRRSGVYPAPAQISRPNVRRR